MRNPFLNWLILVFTFGLYAPVWLFLLARDLHQRAGLPERFLKFHGRGLLTGYLTCLALAGVGMFLPDSAIPFFSSVATVIGLVVTVYFIWLECVLAGAIRKIGGRAPGAAAVVLLTFLYMIALPLLQSRFNAVAASHGKSG